MYLVEDNLNGHLDNFFLAFDFFLVLIETGALIFFLDLRMSDEQKTELLHESKRTIFDMNNLHPEVQNRLRMLGFITIDTNGEQQEATNDKIDAILRKTMQSEDPNILADKYMMKHSLYELFKVDFYF